MPRCRLSPWRFAANIGSRLDPGPPGSRSPKPIDLLDLADRARGLVGHGGDPGSRVLPVGEPPGDLAAGRFLGPVPQWGFALLVLRVLPGVRVARAGPAMASRPCSTVRWPAPSSSSARGSSTATGPAGFVFAFRVLPTVIFVAALFAVLYHLGVMQRIVRVFALVMAWLMGTSGAESLNVAASLFLGQTEAPLTIRPYLPRLTNSELLTVMTAGMAHVSGGVMAAYFAYGVEPRHVLTAVIMTAPGAILLSKMLVPETGTPETLGHVHTADDRPTRTCWTRRPAAPATACTLPSTSRRC